jgi:ADP-ribosyl-[dinitrogen reductase] hydrolase
MTEKNFATQSLLDPHLQDRARGAIVGLAVADALGQSYEMGPRLEESVVLELRARGNFGLGEWTDDTCMAIGVALAAVEANLAEDSGLDKVASNFYDWYAFPKGIGTQTRIVMSYAQPRNAEGLLRESETLFSNAPDRAGNGSLMRTSPIALAYLKDVAELEVAARNISKLTHFNPVTQEACVIWTKAVRHAVLFGNTDGVHIAVSDLEPDRKNYWAEILKRAEQEAPATFSQNGWVVEALQVAWSAIHRTEVGCSDSYLKAIELCIRAGYDTDTTAAICGTLIGAVVGESNIPDNLKQQIHGWPGYKVSDLKVLADSIVARSYASRK